MFKLHLDLHIVFDPPMSEHGRGIVLTREVELPFVPVEGQCIFSRKFDDCPEPEGFVLKDVIWDIDREVFLAHTVLEEVDFSMPHIPGQLRVWFEMGWRFGSYRDAYKSPEDEGDDQSIASSTIDGEDDEDYGEKARQLAWNKRKAETNRVFKALIRHMAETYDNESSAYAFDKTGRYFTDAELKDRKLEGAGVKKFGELKWTFRKMAFEEQEKWRKRTSRYPSLEKLVQELG